MCFSFLQILLLFLFTPGFITFSCHHLCSERESTSEMTWSIGLISSSCLFLFLLDSYEPFQPEQAQPTCKEISRPCMSEDLTFLKVCMSTPGGMYIKFCVDCCHQGNWNEGSDHHSVVFPLPALLILDLLLLHSYWRGIARTISYSFMITSGCKLNLHREHCLCQVWSDWIWLLAGGYKFSVEFFSTDMVSGKKWTNFCVNICTCPDHINHNSLSHFSWRSLPLGQVGYRALLL